MKFSILISSYNKGNYIEKCIKSCLAQSDKNLEIIVVDNYSSDETVKLLEKYSKNVNYIEPHLSYFTPETLKYTLNKAGLLNTTIKGFQIYGYQNYQDIKDNGFKFKKNVKDIDLFKNNYKKNSKEEKWYNDRIQNLTCDTIYIIYSN